MPRATRAELKRNVANAGQILSVLDAVNLAGQSGQAEAPAWSLIPCRGVREAISQHGYGSREHRLALEKAEQGMLDYLAGKDTTDPAFRPSPQEQVACRREKEIGIGGAKGGGKTFLIPLYMLFGNYYPPDPDNLRPVDLSYVNHPGYIGLILRQNLVDMQEIIDKSEAIFSKIGAQWVSEDQRFVFPHSMASVGFGHFADPKSYQKYFGRNIVRLAIDELIQMEKRETYMNIRSCVRSTYPGEMWAQVLATFNPRGGPGIRWVYDHFIEPKIMHRDGSLTPALDKKGKPIQVFGPDGVPVYPPPVVEEPVDVSIWTRLGLRPPGDVGDRVWTRVFIPSTIADNPFITSDYVMNLATMGDEEMTDALLFGRWEMGGGAYFQRFRPTLRPGEPRNACHVVQVGQPPEGLVGLRPKAPYSPEAIPYWAIQYMAGDWGKTHEAPFYRAFQDPDTAQLMVFAEKVFRDTLPEHVGAELARWIREDLLKIPSHQMICAIGQDVESDRIGAGRSVLELLATGAKTVLGPNAVHLPDFLLRRMEQQALETGEELSPETVRDIVNIQRAGLIFRRAINARVIGWQMIRSMMRWMPIVPDEKPLDVGGLLSHLRQGGEKGRRQFEEAVRDRVGGRLVVLPALQIYSTCERLIQAIQVARRREGYPEDIEKKHFLGADSLDALRYLVMLFDSQATALEPVDLVVERQMKEVLQQAERAKQTGSVRPSMASLCLVRDRLEAEATGRRNPVEVLERFRFGQGGGPGRVNRGSLRRGRSGGWSSEAYRFPLSPGARGAIIEQVGREVDRGLGKNEKPE